MDDTLFESIMNAFAHMDKVEQKNKCANCKTEMEIVNCEYQCGGCGYVAPILTESYDAKDNTIGGTIRISTGSRKGRLYTINGNSSQLVSRGTMVQLLQNQSKYSGSAFPLDVLSSVAQLYVAIQAEYVSRGMEKRFVHRGDIKDGILAALIKFECNRRRMNRKNKDIAAFMGLKSNGFAKGENIVRKLHAKGIINIVVEESPIEGYLERYMETPPFNVPKYKLFIIDIINESERCHMCIKSQISSKIVSCMWLLNEHCHLGLTDVQLEDCTDKTKRNTFIKFYNVIMANLPVFVNIFNKYGIPYTTIPF